MEEAEKIKVKTISPRSMQVMLDKISFGCILVGLFLLPFFFIPSAAYPFQFTKTYVVAFTVLLAFVAYVIARLKEGGIRVPQKLLLYSSLGVVLVTLASALFSGTVGLSMIGQGFEIGTFLSIFVFFVLMFVTSDVFRGRERIFYAFIAFFLSSALVFIFQALRLVNPAWLSFNGLFSSSVSNLIGRWNDVGIFFGGTAFLALLMTEMLTLNRIFRGILYIILAASIVFLAIVNFTLVWTVLGLFSVVLFVYLVSVKRQTGIFAGDASDSSPMSLRRKISYAALVVAIISGIFIIDSFLTNQPIGSALSKFANVSQVEARPSWRSTFDIVTHTWSRHPVLGVGPNQFTEEWLLTKPTAVNSTIFWNTDFSFGVGYIPTTAVTTGILGLLTWIAFLIAFLFCGFRAIFYTSGDPFGRFLTISSFFVSVYFWTFSVFYVPSIVIVSLTYFFTGLFIASQGGGNGAMAGEIVFSNNPRKGFSFVLILIALMVGAIASLAVYSEKFLSFVSFQKAVLAYNTTGSIATTDAYLTKAVGISDSDLYDRFLSQLSLIKMNDLLSKNQNNSNSDAFKTQFQTLFGDALRYAKQATMLNASDYQNWVSLGQVYDAVVPLKIAGAYDNALTNYKQALSRNPESPSIYLILARLELANGNTKNATDYISTAIAKKQDYTDAIFLLSQIQVSQGNLDAATISVEKISQLNPNDPTVFFQLGFLRYNQKNYPKAIEALERAVQLAPNYSNAMYFLGLSYYQVGKGVDAIAAFTKLQTLNQDNKEVALILQNLKAGKSPFTNAKPPISASPEKRATPPIQDHKVNQGADQVVQ